MGWNWTDVRFPYFFRGVDRYGVVHYLVGGQTSILNLVTGRQSLSSFLGVALTGRVLVN